MKTLQTYQPSGKVNPWRLLWRTTFIVLPLLAVFSWAYALVMLMNPPWWFAPLATLLFAACVAATVSRGLRYGHSRSVAVNTMMAIGLCVVVVWLRWLVTFRGFGTEQALAFAHAGMIDNLGMLWQLAATQAAQDATEFSSAWRCFFWLLELLFIAALTVGVSREEARKPYSETAKRWAEKEEGGELYWEGGRSIELEAHLVAHGPSALCNMLRASALQIGTVASEWWTAHVTGWKVEADSAARWLAIEIVLQQRDQDGKVKTLRQPLANAWHVSVDEYDAVLAHLSADGAATTQRRMTVVSPDVVDGFFRSPSNFAGKSLPEIFEEIGPPDDHDDWDWGRVMYYWRSPHRCVQLETQGGTPVGVYLMDPQDKRRFGEPIEVIWESSKKDEAPASVNPGADHSPEASTNASEQVDRPTPPELQAAVAALQAENHASAITLASGQCQHPDPAVKADALRVCALAHSALAQWPQAFEAFHALFDLESTAHNALQLATTSVMCGELTRGQAWFDKAEDINVGSHEMPSPRLRTAYMSALEEAGETAALLPHLNWLAAAYKAVSTTDSNFLWMQGLPFLSTFLDKASPVLRDSLPREELVKWYRDLADGLDDEGRVAVTEHAAAHGLST